MIILPASIGQAQALAVLHAASFGKAAWDRQQIESSLALPTTRGWIAAADGNPVGFVLGQIAGGEAEILTLAVHPDSRRRGVGKRLLQEFTDALQTAKIERIFLEVAADNHAAAKLYEERGFRRFGIRANYYRRGAVTVDALLYERILSEQ